VRTNLPRALACWRGLLNPVAEHEDFLELVLAVAGPGFQRSYDRFRSSPDGSRLLAERPDIVSVLTDTERLATCTPGSLGHAYADFMTQNRLDAGLYGDAYHDLPAIAERLGWDDDFHYVIRRGIALHDILHVLGGYGPDAGGEFGVLGFTHGQVGGWSTSGGRGLLLAVPLGVPRIQRIRWWRQCVQRGQAASLLFAAPYEELLDEPLHDVRRDLHVVPDEIAHPDGHLYSGYQFGSARSRGMERPYEPYAYEPTRPVAGPSPTAPRESSA